MEMNTTQIPLTQTIHSIRLTTLPSMPAVFCKLLALALARKPKLTSTARIPKGQLYLTGFLPDPDRIHQYRQVCGFESTDRTIPPSYLQTLFIGMLGRYITSDLFPVNPMGLVQTGQWFEAVHPVEPGDSLDLFCTLEDMTRTVKGIVTRFHLAVYRENTRVWQGISTYLTRDPAAPRPRAKQPGTDQSLPPQLTILVPSGTGRRYAKVSGDYNPHHLFDTTARLIGFKQAMAHGMWSLARTLAGLEKPMAHAPCFAVDAAFKLPVYMPATLTLGYSHQAVGATENRIDFELRDAADRRPHLKGRVTYPGRKS
jgi:acyl dehydratase